MLIDFSVRNYRSIKDTLTFSMLKSSSSELMESNTFKVEKPSMELLRSTVIYGANASGKSNVIKAIRTLKSLVISSANDRNSGEELDVKPFKYNDICAQNPTEFEVTFIFDGIKYQYGTVVSRNRIEEEWLIAYPKGRPQRWFTRIYDENSGETLYKFSESFHGPKSTYQETTRENSLFLSNVVQLNNKQLFPVYNWFKEKLHFGGIFGYSNVFSAKLCTDKKTKKELLNFLNAADMSIDDINVKAVTFNVDDLPVDVPEEVRSHLANELKEHVDYEVNIIRNDHNGKPVSLEIDEESDGTQKLFGLIGPVIDTLNSGLILVIDELHSNLHPKMVEYLVSLFNSKDINKYNAQLIFTTHETSIFSQDIFRRDQIWFTEKVNLETNLYSLLDFSPRKGTENIELGYLSGRYGALPFIDKLIKWVN